jgi:hypothetical protein
VDVTVRRKLEQAEESIRDAAQSGESHMSIAGKVLSIVPNAVPTNRNRSDPGRERLERMLRLRYPSSSARPKEKVLRSWSTQFKGYEPAIPVTP